MGRENVARAIYTGHAAHSIGKQVFGTDMLQWEHVPEWVRESCYLAADNAIAELKRMGLLRA